MSAPDGAGRGSIYIQNETLRRGFTSTPNRVLCNAVLSMGARFVYTLLLSYAWQDDRCFPGQERLARDVGCSVRTVQRYLTELEEAGEIRVIQQGLQRPNIYVILDRRSDTTQLSRQDAPIPSSLDAPSMSSAETPIPSPPETPRVSHNKRTSSIRRKHTEENTRGGAAAHETVPSPAPATPSNHRQQSHNSPFLFPPAIQSPPTVPASSKLNSSPKPPPLPPDPHEQAIGMLLAEGVSTRRASSLARRFVLAEIVQQIRWLEHRRYDDRAGCLVAAIEGRYGPPVPNGSLSRHTADQNGAPHTGERGGTARYTSGNYGVCPACLSSPCDPDCPLSGT